MSHGSVHHNALPVPLIVMMMCLGCHRSSATATSQPTTDSATTAPALPTTVPMSVLSIDGRPTAFPACHVKLDDAGSAGTMNVLLYTDASALALDATANTVMLSFTVRADSPADVVNAACHLARQSTDADADTPNGLFLDGSQRQLVPVDVDVTFGGSPDVLTATINGTFAAMTSDGGAPRTVTVQGSLSALVEP